MSAKTIQKDDIIRLRELAQTLYRRLGMLQRDEICCAGVTVPQCYAMQILSMEGEMPPGELAERLGIDPSSATRAVDVLVRNGYAERVRPESGDRRKVSIKLTPKGERLNTKLISAGDTFFERILERFSVSDRASVIRAMELLADAMNDTVGCCDPFGLADRESASPEAERRRR
jgi:DNA-binding MarR family transcriptional regulator